MARVARAVKAKATVGDVSAGWTAGGDELREVVDAGMGRQAAEFD
jgi:hypothetical protein